jgi:hypothetical protein
MNEEDVFEYMHTHNEMLILCSLLMSAHGFLITSERVEE